MWWATRPAVGRLLGLLGAKHNVFRWGLVSAGGQFSGRSCKQWTSTFTCFYRLLKTSRCESGPLLRQCKLYGNRLFIINKVHFFCLI